MLYTLSFETPFLQSLLGSRNKVSLAHDNYVVFVVLGFILGLAVLVTRHFKN
jgi:hypothetical protein